MSRRTLKADVGNALEAALEATGKPYSRDGNTFTITEDALLSNSGDQLPIPVELPEAHRAADDRLRLLIERVENLEEEKKGITADIKDVYAEAKATGYDAKIMKQIVRLRKMKPDDRREMEAVLQTYLCALGMD